MKFFKCLFKKHSCASKCEKCSCEDQCKCDCKDEKKCECKQDECKCDCKCENSSCAK